MRYSTSPQITSGVAITSIGELSLVARRSAFALGNRDPISGAMHLDLTDDEAAALTQELYEIVENDRHPFSVSRSHLRCSPRIRLLRGILAKLRPEPVRKPLPPPKVYAPPSKGRYRRRAWVQ